MKLSTAVFVVVLSLGLQAQQTALFLREADEPLESYSGTRRLEGQGLGRFGWIEAVTKYSEAGFDFKVSSSGGSSTVLNRVLMPLLLAEKSGTALASAFTTENYRIRGQAKIKDGLVGFRLEPRRKEVGLLDGYIFIRPDSFEIVRVEGNPAKDPSALAMNEFVTKHYETISGVRVPIRATVSARILFKSSNITIYYRYHTINGRSVESQPR